MLIMLLAMPRTAAVTALADARVGTQKVLTLGAREGSSARTDPGVADRYEDFQLRSGMPYGQRRHSGHDSQHELCNK